MKRNILAVGFLMLTSCVHAQIFSAQHLLDAGTMPASKFEKYILKKSFVSAEKKSSSADSITSYKFNKPLTKKNKIKDSTVRLLEKTESKNDPLLVYQTSSVSEYYELKTQLKAIGFYCSQENDSASLPALLYQHNNITIVTSTQTIDSISLYSFSIKKKIFPSSKDIYYADDLLIFNSHEYLSFYFGEKNVKKDICFLPGNKSAECSVLFPNTALQAVFIWKDDINLRTITNLLLGGQLKLQSARNSASFVGESNWVCKSGIRAGMTLYELRKLNENNFKFYGMRTSNGGSIVPEGNGKIDFKKEDITLSCINCNDSEFLKTSQVDADDALAEGRIVFVLSVNLNAEEMAKVK